MSTSTNRQNKLIGHLAHHSIHHGVFALLLAIVHLILLQGVSVGALWLFVLPPLVAVAMLRRSTAKGERRLALVFLFLVALGAAVAPFPAILPKLGGVDRRLPAESDRLLTWYTVVYLLFFVGIMPARFLAANLRRHRRGEPAEISRFTCYLGVLTLAVMWPVLPVLLGALLGLWPLPR